VLPIELHPVPIVDASKLSFSPTPYCPACGAGVLPYSRHEPLVVDEELRVFCRQHGAEVNPEYATKLADYWTMLRKRRLAAFDALEAEPPEDAAPSAE
jgi:hypothetical protein